MTVREKIKKLKEMKQSSGAHDYWEVFYTVRGWDLALSVRGSFSFTHRISIPDFLDFLENMSDLELEVLLGE